MNIIFIHGKFLNYMNFRLLPVAILDNVCLAHGVDRFASCVICYFDGHHS